MHRGTPLTCHSEERSDIGNLAVPWWITGRLWRKRNCLPEIATSAVGLLAMTNLGALLDRRACLQICSCHRRSLSAATDAIGAYHFIGSWFASAVPSRDCHARWGLAMTNLEAFAVLTIACTNRKRCAGSGMPLPYRVHALNRSIRRSSAVTRRQFSWAAARSAPSPFADHGRTGVRLAPNHLDTALALCTFDRKERTARHAEHIDIYAVVVAETTIGGLIALHRAKTAPSSR